MKKTMAILAAAALALGLAACSGTKDAQETTAATTAAAATDTAKATDTVAASDTESVTDTAKATDTGSAADTEPTTAETAAETVPRATDYDPTKIDSEVRMFLQTQKYKYGVAYLGTVGVNGGVGGYAEDRSLYEKVFDESGALARFDYVNKFPEDRFVDAGGYDLFYIIPAWYYSKVTVYSYDWTAQGGAGQPGEALFSSIIGEPIMVRCLCGDVAPNVLVVIEDTQGNVIKYRPGFSGADGTVLTDGGGYDFTDYDRTVAY